jgi:ATP-dependent DNA helicase PIF1
MQGPERKRLKMDTASHIHLDPKQKHILDLCLTGKNIFFTGIGGTGKTFLLQQIAEGMRRKLGASKVAVAASTGVAAVICQGQTLHSLAGCGVPSVVSDFDKCWKQKHVWMGLAVLIIDEVSMLDPTYIDWLDATVRSIRKTPTKAFGGIQLILCGDFGQLPGICKGVSIASKCPINIDFSVKRIPVQVNQFQGYVFQTVCWRDAAFVYCELTTVFRQSEVAMVSALTKIRRGQLDTEVLSFIDSCTRELSLDEEIKPTVLYARNKDVDAENVSKLAALPGDPIAFEAIDSVIPDKCSPVWVRERMLSDNFFRSALVPERVVLKVGAQVMLTKNMPSVGLVNGSRGVVKHFINKEQSIENLTARTTGKLCLDIAARQIMDSQLQAIRNGPVTAVYPVVLFCNGKELLCSPVEFNHRIYMTGDCRRVQVPLKLAWALTMHKCQGDTLDKVQVDLTGCFSPGQCYVALSRAKATSGLQITGFTKDTVKTHPLAIAFHDALTAGTVDAFLSTVPRWFDPLLQAGVDPNWRSLFESSKVFRKWTTASAPAASV